MISDHPQEFLIIVNTDARVSRSVTTRDFCGRIRTAVIDDSAFPVLMGLRQDAFDALGEMLSTVIDGSNYADQRLRHVRTPIDWLGRNQRAFLD